LECSKERAAQVWSATVTQSIRAVECCAAGPGVLDLAPALTQPACWRARPPTRLAELWVHGVERAVLTFTRASSSELEHSRACGQDTVVGSGPILAGRNRSAHWGTEDHRKRSLTTPAGRRGQQAGSPRSPTSMPTRVALPHGEHTRPRVSISASRRDQSLRAADEIHRPPRDATRPAGEHLRPRRLERVSHPRPARPTASFISGEHPKSGAIMFRRDAETYPRDAGAPPAWHCAVGMKRCGRRGRAGCRTPRRLRPSCFGNSSPSS
jgi:hypothetical protein